MPWRFHKQQKHFLVSTKMIDHLNLPLFTPGIYLFKKCHKLVCFRYNFKKDFTCHGTDRIKTIAPQNVCSTCNWWLEVLTWLAPQPLKESLNKCMFQWKSRDSDHVTSPTNPLQLNLRGVRRKRPICENALVENALFFKCCREREVKCSLRHWQLLSI